jgi:hypothetical protein
VTDAELEEPHNAEPETWNAIEAIRNIIINQRRQTKCFIDRETYS